MSISTACPSVVHVRRSVEKHILDLYESDGATLKDYSEWPGFYTLPDSSRIPAVFVVGAEMVPSDWLISGIETTIQDVPFCRDLGTKGALVSSEDWTVQFINYGNRSGTSIPISLRDISRRFVRAFPGDPLSHAPRTEATFESLTAQIRSVVINPPIP